MNGYTGEIDLSSYHNRIRDGVCDIVSALLPRASTPLHIDLVLERVVEFAEGMTADLNRQYPVEEPLACAAGCSFCCYNHEVHVSSLEAIRIARFVSTRIPDEQRAAIGERTNNSMARKRDIENRQGASATRKIQACPLLDPDTGLCQVYEVRPLVCRGHNSINLGMCQARHASGIEEGVRIIGGAVQRAVAQAVLAGLRKAVMEQGHVDQVLDLTRALELLLPSPGSIQSVLDDPARLDDARARTSE